jgi:hypothetical protein
MSVRLLTVGDLAERWGLTTDQVADLVREQGVPYVPLRRGTSPRVSWSNMRFREAAIEAWETANERIHPTAKRAGIKPPQAARPRILANLGEY